MERELEMAPARDLPIAWFAMVVVVLAFASGATAQGRYETMQDFAPGLERPMVMAVQEKLNEFGYATPVTGMMGGRTVDAIRNYQRDAGLPVTGRADQALINRLNFGPPVRNDRIAAPVPPRPARLPPRPAVAEEGSPQVKWVQERLAAAGYQPGPADGLMGQRTADAVARFRRDKGMPPGGIDMGLIQTLDGS